MLQTFLPGLNISGIALLGTPSPFELSPSDYLLLYIKHKWINIMLETSVVRMWVMNWVKVGHSWATTLCWRKLDESLPGFHFQSFKRNSHLLTHSTRSTSGKKTQAGSSETLAPTTLRSKDEGPNNHRLVKTTPDIQIFDSPLFQGRMQGPDQ